MSEHTHIKGKCNYYHIPYREENGFTYCNRCKRFVDKIEIQFHEGWLSDWMLVKCGHCNKAIWVMEFAGDSSRKSGKRIFIVDDKICAICKKPTNHYDCVASGGNIRDKTNYWCSNKCYNIRNKIDEKVNFYWSELILDLEKQGIEFDGKFILKLARQIYNEKENQARKLS